MIDEALPSQESADETLAMVVWLDDAAHLCEEFSMDADEVMQELGIKRSRLTQISGKELRVGRLRIDKYTKPFYRVEDVAAYKSWTRATASHQSSAQAINSALAKLDQQVVDLNGALLPPLNEFKEQLEAAIESGFSRTLKQQQRNFLNGSQLLGKILGVLETAAGRDHRAGGKLARLLSESKEIAATMAQSGQANLTMLTEIMASIVETQKTHSESQQKTHELIEQLRPQMATVHEDVKTGFHEMAEEMDLIRQDVLKIFSGHLSGLWERMLSSRMSEQKNEIVAEIARMIGEERQARCDAQERQIVLMGSLHASLMDTMARSEEQAHHQRELLEALLAARVVIDPFEEEISGFAPRSELESEAK